MNKPDDSMNCKDGDHWDYFVPHVAAAGQENFLDGKSWATVYVSQFHCSCSKLTGTSVSRWIRMSSTSLSPTGTVMERPTNS